jgi:hypothetical protein
MSFVHAVTHRIVDVAGPSLVIQESLYGFIMALIFITSAQLHLVHYESASYLIAVIIGMNFTWGAIDMVIFYMIDRFDQDSYVRTIMNKDIDPANARQEMFDDLSGTIADIITYEDEQKVIDVMMKSQLESGEDIIDERHKLLMSAVMCFVITLLTTIPVIIPLMFISDQTTALFVASGIAATCLFFIGYHLAPYMGVGKWKLGLTMTFFAWVITIIAVYTGG